jgi:putative oxygen-independent coproporphyrinogen III oxidase
MRGIYVHVPFCLRKCGYCDFYSVVAGDGARDEFCDLVARELELIRRSFPDEARQPADTVYFGGGTPTVLGSDRLCRLLATIRSALPVVEDAEITAEANPGTVDARDLERLREAGFTRLSLGVQSFHAPTLAALGRIHSGDDIRAAWRHARRWGFPSAGMDLIFGNPGQDEELWTDDLRRAITLQPDHLSAYALTPERGTPLHGEIQRGERSLPSDDAVARMYDAVRTTLVSEGYNHYEISNFARPGKECRHNGKYWSREGYLGLGPSAHGLLFPGPDAPLGMRTANPRSLRAYASRLEEGRLPWLDTAISSVDDAWKEFLLFGLRLADGVSLAEGEKRYGPPPDELREAVEPLVATGSLVREDDRLRMPQTLWFVSNEVLARLA